jgi:hypothetical protein
MANGQPSAMTVPTRPAQITPAFLTSVLKSAGVLHQARVTSLDIEPLAAKTRFNAQLLRVYPVYNSEEENTPRSLVAKLPTVDSELHQRADVFQPGTKETWFYSQGAARSPLNVPRCYYAAVAGATGESALLLEDLAPAQTGDWREGVSVDEAQLALRSLARLHAAWWVTDSTSGQQLAHLMDNSSEAQALVDHLYAEAWPRFLSRAGLTIPNDVLQLGQYLVGRISGAEATLERAPRTLAHGDYRLGNILFGRRDGEPACWVIDWEDIMLWSGMFDVAWFLGSCLPLIHSAEEKGLVRSYSQALIREGVAAYSWSQCYHDYRCAMLSAFVQGVLTATPSGDTDQYARDLSHVIAERFISACQRLRLYDLVPF